VKFLVDDHHVGTPAEVWRRWPVLDALRRLDLGEATRLVVVAPHPDDEVIGAGGLMMAATRLGRSVEIVAVTDGEGSHPRSETHSPSRLVDRRQAEVAEAMRRLGCAGATRTRLGLPDSGVAAHERALTEQLTAVVDPRTLCVAPWEADGHPDHDACGRAASAACALRRAPLVRYLVWTWHWAVPGDALVPWSRGRSVSLTRSEQARKRWAVGAFRSQIRPLSPGPGDETVLPAPVLRRAWAPLEVFLV